MTQVRRKAGGIDIPVTIGDFAAVPVDGTFNLIFVVYNTIYNLLTQDDQVRCFENVAKHLASDGVFVLEAEMPTDYVCTRNKQYVDAERVELDQVTLDVARFDISTQLLDESHIRISEQGITLSPIVTRYIWPSEMDLMARIAGLRLVERFANWQQAPFDVHSRAHVSVYGINAGH